MSQPEKKLDKFESAVLHDAEEQRSKILDEINEYRKSQMEKAEEEILHESYVLIQSEIAAIKNKHSRKISLSELDGRRKLLILREELSQKVFDEAAGRITGFTKTDDYKTYITEAVKRACSQMPDGTVIIYVKKDDLPLSDILISASGRKATVEADVNIALGGVLVSNTEKGVVVDETLDLKLGSQKEWFASASGLSIGM